MATGPRSRNLDLKSELFGRATPEPPASTGGIGRVSQVGGGRMDWTHERPHNHKQLQTHDSNCRERRTSAENWHARQLDLASYGMSGGPHGTVAEALGRPAPGSAPSVGRPGSPNLSAHRQRHLALDTTSTMRERARCARRSTRREPRLYARSLRARTRRRASALTRARTCICLCLWPVAHARHVPARGRFPTAPPPTLHSAAPFSRPAVRRHSAPAIPAREQ
jgi:hypothetical protein